MKWGTEEIVRFLDIYAVHKCLWDFNDENFRNKQRRVAALEAIVRELNVDGLTVNELQTKIHSIRNTYTNELRKMQASKTSGCGSDQVYKTKIPWFELADSFLRKIVHRRKGYTNLDYKENQAEIEQAVEESVINEPGSPPTASGININDIFDLPCSSNNTTNLLSSSTAKAKAPTKKRRSEDPFVHLESAVDALRCITNRPDEEEDETAVFCKSIAKQMRKLPEIYNLELMEEIQSLVTYKRKCFLSARQSEEQIPAGQFLATEDILGGEEVISQD